MSALPGRASGGEHQQGSARRSQCGSRLLRSSDSCVARLEWPCGDAASARRDARAHPLRIDCVLLGRRARRPRGFLSGVRNSGDPRQPLRDFKGLVEKTLPVSFAGTMQRGQPIGNLLPSFNAKFYGGPIYHLVYRPYRLHHAIDLVVRDNGKGIGKGAMVIGRSARQPEFNALDAAICSSCCLTSRTSCTHKRKPRSPTSPTAVNPAW